MSDEYLRSERVLLRQYRPDDLERLLELDSDPEVMRYLTGRPSTRDEVEGGAERILHCQRKFGGRLGVFMAELLETGEFMGWFILRPDKANLDNTKELELGYRLKRAFWGKGYATEVSRLLVRKAFDELGAESVFAKADARNLASRKVMEKVGLRFEREGIDPQNPDRGLTAWHRLERPER